MSKAVPLLAIVVTLFLRQAAKGARWCVDESVSDSGYGYSWEMAFKTIQEGIDASTDGDTVIVAPGTYAEYIHFGGKNIVLASTNPLDRKVVEQTVVDGNVTFSGTENETCVLRGFKICNGWAYEGGGVCGGTWGLRTRASITDNIIIGNSVSGQYSGGGGVAFCDGRISNNVVADNSAEWFGGGLFCCDGLIENNLIIANSGRYGGGVSSAYGTIQNCTVCDNWVSGGGGGIAGCGGLIRNCIVWGNRAGGPGKQIHESSTPMHSCIEGWPGGGLGNTGLDPRFVSSEEGDCHLGTGSPCIDAGLNYYWFAWPQRDLDGNCRLVGERVDIGCYEHGSSPDLDGDLMADVEELSAGVDRQSQDTDGDGLRDGLEILRGTDPAAPTPPGIIRVPQEAQMVQQALALAMSGEQIILSPGIYRENLQFCGFDVTLRSSQPSDLGTVASTILDGEQLGPVVSFQGRETRACALSGFTIRNGRSYRAGGVRGHHTHATIGNNIITANFGDSCGGGLDSCDGVVEGNRITQNSAGLGAGLWRCNGTIQNNLITRNMARGEGGGLLNCNGIIQDNRICENSAGAGGGLAWCNGTIQNNLIAANSGGQLGGGLSSCGGMIAGNVIVGNSAEQGGGLNHCEGTVRNNTIVGNSATMVGGGLMWGDAAVQSCIIWANRAPEGSQVRLFRDPLYSCLEGYTGRGEGNISADPLFVDLDGADDDPATYEDNDYRLSPASPCIDAGDNWAVDPSELDLDGNLRIALGRLSLTVDMGAYEYNSLPFAITQIVPVENDRLLITWSSQPRATFMIWFCQDLHTGSWIEERIWPIPSQGATSSCLVPVIQDRAKFYRIEMKRDPGSP
jgi:hypothetical protein